MKFDVIIGNPPYQLSDGGASASAMPLYHKFVQQAKNLNPKYVTMIIPSRWFTSGKGLSKFRKEMLHDKRIRAITDFHDASDCFPGVEIKGGVCYFLWDRDNEGLCKVTSINSSGVKTIAERPLLENNADIFIRYNGAIPILKKVQKFKEERFNKIISTRKPFGLSTSLKGIKTDSKKTKVKIFANRKRGYIERSKITRNDSWIDQYKLFVPYAIGSGNSKTDVVKPIVAGPGTCCTETYLVFGPFENRKLAVNAKSYISTRFFHFLLTLKKNTQHATRRVYEFVPEQDYNESWSDEKLYEKYNFTDEEISFIESMVQPNRENK